MQYKGVCHTNFEERVSSAGKPYGAFHINSVGKIWQVLVFKNAVEYAKTHVKIDEKIIVEGKQGDGEEAIILAHSIKFPALQTAPKWDRKKLTEDYREYVKEWEARGYVEWRDEHGSSRLLQKKYCLCVAGKWIPTIEFAMDVFGTKNVELLLKEIGITDWAIKDWSKKREAINSIGDAAICKYRDDNGQGISIVKGYEEAEQVQGNSDGGGRQVVCLESGGTEVYGATNLGSSGDN